MVEQIGSGGFGDYTGELVRALAEAGVAVEVVTAPDHTLDLPPAVPVHGLVRYLRPTSKLRRALRGAGLAPVVNALFFLAALPRIASLARRCRLVHVQAGYPILLLPLVAALRILRVGVVHTPHNTFDRRFAVPCARLLLERAVARIVVHARADLPALTAAGRRRAVVIAHGEYGAVARRSGPVSPMQAREAMGIEEGEVVALMFGQMRADKGIRDAVLAARAVPGLALLLAGKELGGLADAADLLAQAPVVVREGFQDASATGEAFAAADVVLLPYRQASQSGVLLLAYGFGRPVVVYPVGGLPEAVEDGVTGWLCARPDADALVETLRSVVAAGRDECARRGAEGERLARERFAWSTVARETVAVYSVIAPS